MLLTARVSRDPLHSGNPIDVLDVSNIRLLRAILGLDTRTVENQMTYASPILLLCLRRQKLPPIVAERSRQISLPLGNIYLSSYTALL
jgi:hypothetical protein